MDSLLARLSRGERLVGDGAWGTQLMLRGLPAGQPPEWFALERPEVIEEVARLYVEAGADLVTTDTFGGSSFRLKLHGLDGERGRINRQAVEAVRRAVAGRALVSASVGPSGQLLEPFGDTPAGAVEAAFEEQIAVLAEAGADVLCIETMSDLGEATLALRAAKRAAPALPVIATSGTEAMGEVTVHLEKGVLTEGEYRMALAEVPNINGMQKKVDETIAGRVQRFFRDTLRFLH